MESVILKIAESSPIPILILILYVVSKSSLLSTMNASNVERLFFTQEKKALHKLSNMFLGLIFTLFLMSIVTFPLYTFLQENHINDSTYQIVNIITNVFIIIILFMPFVIRYLKKVKFKFKLCKKISQNEALTDIIEFIGIVVLIINFSIQNVIIVCENFKENQLGYLVLAVLVSSIVYALIVVDVFKSYISSNRNYYINDDSTKWYIIKPLDKDVYILGDNQKEESCTKIKILSKEKLINKEINIEKVNINNSIQQVQHINTHRTGHEENSI